MDAGVCQGCLERGARICVLEGRVAELEAEVRDLLARLGRNASNSSLPPSANPPGAPKPVLKKKSQRKPGGQPNHPPHLRKLVPPERVNETLPYLPTHCQRCHQALPAEAGGNDPEPTRHQVAELPKLGAWITEHQGHARTCPGCGAVTRAAIPTEVREQSCGPRLAATLSYLTGCHHVSKRGLEEIVETVFDAPIGLGTVSNLEQQMSAALASAHTEALAAVRQAPVKHVDETGWKQAGQKRWLWLAASRRVAAFLIHPRRNLSALVELVGRKLRGFYCTDRWGTYNRLPVMRRQLCWAHLKRDFQKCVDRGGAAGTFGQEGLRLTAKIFQVWNRFRHRKWTRRHLQQRLSPVARCFGDLLKRGRHCTDQKTATFFQNLLELEPALWRFAVSKGVEPTNNHAERLQRRAVLWRKNAFGCHSQTGCRFVERILTVVQTLRLQGRRVLDYLYEALLAHRAGRSPPKLCCER